MPVSSSQKTSSIAFEKANDDLQVIFGRGQAWKSFLFIGFCVFLIAYLMFHSIEGQRGLFVLDHFNQKLETAETQLSTIQQERAALEIEAKGLRSASLDPDLVDLKIREQLGYIQENEYIILIK